MKIYRITPKAKQDLKNIGRYTMKMWGKEQRNAYLHKLEYRFAWLAEHSYNGRYRPDVHDGYYSYPEGMHIIFYLIRDDGIDVIGIPHQRMNVVQHFFPMAF
jgi:toxin ParE1/3/4